MIEFKHILEESVYNGAYDKRNLKKLIQYMKVQDANLFGIHFGQSEWRSEEQLGKNDWNAMDGLYMFDGHQVLDMFEKFQLFRVDDLS